MIFRLRHAWLLTMLAPAFLPLAAGAPVAALPAPAGPVRAAGWPHQVQLASTEHEALSGIAFAIVQEAYRRIGIEAGRADLPGERALQMLNAGDYDGDVMHMAGLDAVYPKLLRVPVPVIEFDAVAFSIDVASPPDNWAGLRPYRVCVRRGIKAIEGATAGLPHVLPVNQYANIFGMLKAGRCDVAVLPRSAWVDAARLHVSGLHESSAPLQHWPLYHYVYSSHADLVPALSAELLKMQKSGYMARKQAELTRQLDSISHGDMPSP